MRLLELRTIVVASDLTAASNAAMRTAVDLSRASGAALHAVHVAPHTEDSRAEDERRTHDRSALDGELRRFGAGAGAFETHVLSGEPASSIGELSSKVNADVVILGRRRTSAPATNDSSFGGTAHAVMARSQALCLAVATPLTLPISNAVAAIDTSESARGAMLVAVSWVSLLRDTAPAAGHPTLTAVYVDTGTDASRQSGTVAAKMIEHELSVLRRNAGPWAGVSVHAETIEAEDPATAVAQFARDHGSQLVVVGSRPPEHREVGLSSVSMGLALRLDPPLLLVPPGVWRSYTKDVDYF